MIVQNQTGHSPKKWDRSGVVVETKSNDQYVVKMSGSGRLTLRNRRFLKKYTLPTGTNQPMSPAPPIPLSHSPAVATEPPPTPRVPPTPKTPAPQVEPADGRLSTLVTPLPPVITRPPEPDHTVRTANCAGTTRTVFRRIRGRANAMRATPVATSPEVELRHSVGVDVPIPRETTPHATSPKVGLRHSRRVRPQRQMYDANTGLSKKPTPVPDDV